MLRGSFCFAGLRGGFAFSTIRTIEKAWQMTKSRANLTELEGAILGVLRRSPGMTAYAVRQVFLSSSSAEWSGSAGAVYPAIARLQTAGFVAARAAGDSRGTKTLGVARAGKTALDRWLCDTERAAGPGLDPFRTRAGLWSELAPGARRRLMRDLKVAITRQREILASGPKPTDAADAVTMELHLALLDMRLRWLDEATRKRSTLR